MNRILITGGGGMLGKHLKEEFPEGYFPSKDEMNLLDYTSVVATIRHYQPTHVVHAAAKVGGIMDNINKPCDFLEENLLINTNIIKAARINNIPNLLCILSTCIFPDAVDNYPMDESMLFDGSPTSTNFSYGYAKRCAAIQIDSSNKQYNTQYNYIIPCNLYSEYDSVSSQNKMHFITSLLEKIRIAEINNQNTISLFGTGKPLRQFMYAEDLAKIIKYMLDNNIYENFCVAPDNHNYTIEYMARTILDILGKSQIKIQYDSSKPDGQYRKDVSNELMKKFIPDFKFSTFQETIPRIYNRNANRPITQVAKNINT
jgi:GDP-L-fucose synthase